MAASGAIISLRRMSPASPNVLQMQVAHDTGEPGNQAAKPQRSLAETSLTL